MSRTVHVRRTILGASLAMVVLTSCASMSGGVSGPTASSAPATGVPQLRPVDGGTDYYDGFLNGLPTDESYFPVGVWLENILDPPDLQKDRDNGINTYVDITADSDPAQLDGSDASFLASWPHADSRGFVVSDEVDMWAGPGRGNWTGNFPGEGPICEPAESTCGYSVQEQLAARAEPAGILRYANYGKGVTFWQTDEQASTFVNGFQDIVSADNYWFTDPNICSRHEGGRILSEPRDLTDEECRRASNYGWTVERMRSLVQPLGSRPVWAFVEVGHPFPDPGATTISPPQIRAAVWSSIIHGARGIIYFNHSFGGQCPSHHVLRDCGPELSEPVSELNAQLRELAPALNSETIVEAATSAADVDLLAKRDHADIIVIAGSTEHGRQDDAAIRVRCAGDGDAEVMWEGRTVPVVDGTVRDSFADAEAVHVYRITGNTCGWR